MTKKPCSYGRALLAISPLLVATAFGQTLVNPSFETDTFSVAPGTVSANSAITGWTVSDPTKAGLAPAGGLNAFANNGTLPDGANALFLQATCVAGTTIADLSAGVEYTVRFRVNSTAGTAPTLRVALDDAPSIFDAGGVVSVAPAGQPGPWKYVALNFTATAATHTLFVTNNGAAGTTLLLDDLRVGVSSGKWSVAQWSDDATSGVDSSKRYTHAFALNTSGASFTINSVPFTRLSGGNPSLRYEFTGTLGAGTTDAANVPRTAGGGSATLASQFAYNGNPEVFAFHNLIPGQEYVATWYTVGWDAAGKSYGRSVTFMAGTEMVSLNQDHFGDNQGTRISYRYAAPASGSMVISNIPFSTTAGTLHTYGVSNYELTSTDEPAIGVQPVSRESLPGSGVGFFVTATGARPLGYQWYKSGAPITDQTNRVLILTNLTAGDLADYLIVVSNSFGLATSSSASLTFSTATFANPSFEGDTYTTWPGYAGDNFPIPGWFASSAGRVGLSLPGAMASPFANNGIPVGANAAFLQNAGNGSNGLSTIVQNLTPGQLYTLSFAVNARAGQVPNLHVAIDGQSLSDIRVSAVGAAGFGAAGLGNPYRRVAFDFTPANSSVFLSLTNNQAGDTTVLLDDFQVAPSTTKWSFATWTDDASSGVDPTKFYTHALNFNSSQDAVINGITFRATPGANPATPGYFSTSGFGSLFANDANVLTALGTGSSVLAKDFLYGGPVQSITLTNLVPGIEYVATIYAVGFDARAYGRSATFNVGDDRQTINLDHFDNDVGLRVSYRYVADASGAMTLTYTPTDAGSTFHTYGFANSQAVGTAPIIATQPVSAFAAVGDQVSLAVFLSAGAQPTYYQWQADGVDIDGQTNAALVLSNLTAGALASYRVVVSNSFGSVTSTVASVEWGLPIADLFNSGVDDTGTFLSGGQADSHYQLVSSEDPSFPGPDALVMHNGAFPLAGNYFLNGPYSSWISPRTNSSVGNSNGFYIYRTSFVIDAVDPARAQINGKWSSDNEGIDIRLNGTSLGISNMISAAFTSFYPFTITNGFLAGSNIIEFVVSNGPASGPTALRTELRGVGRPVPSAAPLIVHQPSDQLVLEGANVTFSVVVTGSAPLRYQWFYEGAELLNETNRSVRILNALAFDHAGSYWVVVDNGVSPPAESRHATLTINTPPTAADDVVASGVDRPVTFAASKLVFNDNDVDGDPLSVVSVSPSSAQNGTVSLAGGFVTYTPSAGFTGDDFFVYTVGDNRGGTATARVVVKVGEANFLSVATPPSMSGNGHFQVGYSGIPGYVYTVERSTSVLGPWSVYTNIVADVNGLFSIDDPNDPPEPNRFYRVIYP